MHPKLHTWLQQQQATVDQLIYQAGNRYYKTQRDHYSFTNLDYDIGVTTLESFNLGSGADLCYDRPTIGFTYSLWYHARRVNTFLMYFLQELSAANPAIPLDIFDLGAGTGAVQWAVGLVYAGMKACGLPVPQLHVINVDSSAFMLEYNRDYLWQQFLLTYPACADISCTFEVNSWNKPAEQHGGAAWVVSSYLFDHAENKEFLAEGFQTLVKLYQPERVMLLTSNQLAKTQQLSLVADAIKSEGYSLMAYNGTTPLFRGALPQVTELRRALRTKRQITTVPFKEVTWDDHSFTAVALVRPQMGLGLVAHSPAVIKALQLYVSPLVVRRDIQLNETQESAATHTTKPTFITGPAGCGKSIVITERIRKLVSIEPAYSPGMSILLTTFNIKLIEKLHSWLANILDEQRARSVKDGFQFVGSAVPNITCLHFDRLPTVLGQASFDEPIRFNDWHFQRMSGIARQVRRRHQLPDEGPHMKVLNAEFLLEEFHRVVYGLGYFTAEQYLNQPRTGRGQKITHKPLVWECFASYFEQLAHGQSFTNRRLEFLRALRSGEVQHKYDFIFVDEYQDCTPADLEIFRHLLHNPDHIVLAGDLAQAVQIGRSSAAEKKFRHFMGLTQKRDNARLQGSYRLPFRISEAIRTLSSQINSLFKGDQDAGVIAPYKGSPPGARPVLVYADNLSQMASKVAEVVRAYACFKLTEVTILEKDGLLRKAIEERVPELPIETDTILKLKGLEKTCIVWSTSIGIEHRGEVFEFIYTILTRTSCLLLITLSPETLDIYLPILQSLRAERMICWDDESEQRFKEIQTQPIATQVEAGEEEDD